MKQVIENTKNQIAAANKAIEAAQTTSNDYNTIGQKLYEQGKTFVED